MSRRWERVREFRNEIRWTVVVVALASLAIVALWPRDQHDAPPAADGPPASASPVADPALRDRARLQPCPSREPAPGGALNGVAGSCLADGAPADMGSVVGGKPTLINVWATWCAPCRGELPVLQEYAQQPDAVQVVGVQAMSDADDGLRMLDELGVHLPTVHDADNRIRAALKSPNLWPASYLVTPSGEVRRVDPPTVFKSPDEVRAAVQRTLGDAG